MFMPTKFHINFIQKEMEAKEVPLNKKCFFVDFRWSRMSKQKLSMDEDEEFEND